MKPLVLTARAVRELATGLDPAALDSSPVLGSYESETALFLIHSDDRLDEQRLILVRDETDHLLGLTVPDKLADYSLEALSRLATFAEYSKKVGYSLPKPWGQYKLNSLVSFFAIPIGYQTGVRWIAEVGNPTGRDVVFWRTTSKDDKEDISIFANLERPNFAFVVNEWPDVFSSLQRNFRTSARETIHHREVELGSVSSEARFRTYSEWLKVITDEQRRFVEMESDVSIRLRGPAGSGKTLALTLKAIREAQRARERDQDTRLLIATHSWALAGQIQQSIDSMGVAGLREIEVFPLLAVAQDILPVANGPGDDFQLLGDDNASGKQLQLNQIEEVIEEFVAGDWITYRDSSSERLRHRIESEIQEDRSALSWDLNLEFGSVLGANAIFPGPGQFQTYASISRTPWMLPLESEEDLAIVFRLYTDYMGRLQERSFITSDQFLSDFLRYLTTHAWNLRRKKDGYDLIFVDEFHLFSPLERQVIHFLTRNTSGYPRISIAVDPRQSASETFIGSASDRTQSSADSSAQSAFTDAKDVVFNSVHRFTPQILRLIQHIDKSYPTFNFGPQWNVDLSVATTQQSDGVLPKLVENRSSEGEVRDILRAVGEVYQDGRIAIAVMSRKKWARYSQLASSLGLNVRPKYAITTITGRSEIEGQSFQKRGVVIGQAEYLAGLQFTSVFIVGLPEIDLLSVGEQTRMLSLLYLAISRAERDVRIFLNDEDSSLPDVFVRAVGDGMLEHVHGVVV